MAWWHSINQRRRKTGVIRRRGIPLSIGKYGRRITWKDFDQGRIRLIIEHIWWGIYSARGCCWFWLGTKIGTTRSAWTGAFFSFSQGFNQDTAFMWAFLSLLAPFKSPRNVPYFSRPSIEVTNPTHATDDVWHRILSSPTIRLQKSAWAFLTVTMSNQIRSNKGGIKRDAVEAGFVQGHSQDFEKKEVPTRQSLLFFKKKAWLDEHMACWCSNSAPISSLTHSSSPKPQAQPPSITGRVSKARGG